MASSLPDLEFKDGLPDLEFDDLPDLEFDEPQPAEVSRAGMESIALLNRARNIGKPAVPERSDIPELRQGKITELDRFKSNLLKGVEGVVDSIANTGRGFADYFVEMDKKALEAMPEGAKAEELKRRETASDFSKAVTIEGDELKDFSQSMERFTEQSGEQFPDLPERKGVAKYFDDLVRTAPQIAAQVGAHITTGPVGGMALMGSQVMGSQYDELKKQGVDTTDAFKASFFNAVAQGGLESIGMNKALSVWKPGKKAGKTIKNILETVGVEFLTETLQAYPEAAADIWAKAQEEQKSPSGQVDQFLTDFWSITKKGMYEGLVAAPFSGLSPAARAVMDKLGDKPVNESEHLVDGQSVDEDVKTTQTDDLPDLEFEKTVVSTDDSLSPDESLIDKAIEGRLSQKYRDLYAAPQSRLPHEDYQGIIDMTTTPHDLEIKIQGAYNKENYIRNTNAAIADLLGGLNETYRYEGFDEGQNIESYIDSLLEVANRKRLSDHALPDIEPPAKADSKTRPIPTDRRINTGSKTEAFGGIVDKVKAAVPSIPGIKPLEPGKKRRRLVREIKKVFSVPIRTGKISQRSARGIYKPDSEVIRLKRANDFPAMIHETGHHFQEILGLNFKMPKEVMDLAYPGAKNKSREGFAEFLRYYVTQPEVARNGAPTFYKTFEAALRESPDIQNVVIKAKQYWNEFQTSPSVQKVQSFIAESKKEKQFPTFDEVYTEFKDNIHPIRKLVEDAKKRGGKFTTDNDPYIIARLTRGWARKAEQFLKHGTFKHTKDGIQKTGKSLREILQPIEMTGDRKLFDTYLIARRAVADQRVMDGFEGVLSPQDFYQTVKELGSKFEAAAQDLDKYNNSLLDYFAESGRMSKELIERIRSNNLSYTPLYRLMDGDTSQKGLGQKAGNTPNPIKKLKGSSRDIFSPTESILKNTYAMINAAERAKIGKALIDLVNNVEGMGHLIEKVPAPLKINKVAKDDFINLFNKFIRLESDEVVDFSAMPDELIASFRKDLFRLRPNEVILFDKGKPVRYELDPFLYKAVANIDAGEINMLIKVLSYPAKWLRAGATTFSPEFGIRNPMRDQMTAFIQSKYGFVPGYDFFKGVFHMVGKTDLWQEFNASGAAHSAIVSVDRDYLSKNLKDLLQSDIKKMVKNPLEALQRISEITEEATRVGEFAKARKKGASLNEAGMAAREVSLDFGRQGGSSARAANLIAAFWNARIEGIDKMIRSFKEQPVKTSLRAFVSVTLPSILLWYAQKDDEYYNELPTWRRVLFWNIVLHNDDGTLKKIIPIPKPFEWGLLFGTIPEMALDWLYTKDPTGMKEALKQVVKTFDLVPVPTGAIPIAEWWANKSYFFDKPLEPRGKEDLEPYMRYGTRTSETTKLIAELMNEVPGLKEVASPAKIENLIRGYTAGFGRIALEGTDWALKTLGAVDVVPEPSITMSDLPGIRAFAVRFPHSNSRSIERFYKDYTKKKRAWETKKERAGVRGKGIRGLNKLDAEIANMEMSAKALSILRRAAQKVYLSGNLTPNEKTQALNNIYYNMINIARKYYGKDPINIRQEN